jgi:putative flippase GtrA
MHTQTADVTKRAVNYSDLLKQLTRHPYKTVTAHKELRYLIAGTASEAIEFFSFVILIAVIPHLLYVANSISFVLGVISGFIFHKTWTFRGEQQFKTHQQLFGYISLAAVNFVMINIFIGVYVHRFRLSPDVAKLAAIATTVVWTYLVSNFVIFRHTSASKPV